MVRTFKILLPIVPLAAIAVAIGTAGQKPVVHDQSGVNQAPAESQAPAVDVTINGQKVDMPPSGQVNVNTGSGSASVNVSQNGEVKTQVTNSNNADVHISVSTSSSGSNNSNSSSFTTTNGFSQTSNNSSVQFNSFNSVDTNN